VPCRDLQPGDLVVNAADTSDPAAIHRVDRVDRVAETA